MNKLKNVFSVIVFTFGLVATSIAQVRADRARRVLPTNPAPRWVHPAATLQRRGASAPRERAAVVALRSTVPGPSSRRPGGDQHVPGRSVPAHGRDGDAPVAVLAPRSVRENGVLETGKRCRTASGAAGVSSGCRSSGCCPMWLMPTR